MSKKNIAVIGAGSFGISMARVLADNEHAVTVYDVDASIIEDINTNHKNSKFFPDVTLPTNLVGSSSMEETVKGAEYVLLVVPTKFMRDALGNMKDFLGADTVVINASKGIEPGTNKRVSEVVAEELGTDRKFAAISGPSHAEELVYCQLTAVTCASDFPECLDDIQGMFSNDYFRVYKTDDLIGFEVGASIKNVIALGSGILAGLGFGDNARAALITRSMVEMQALGVKLGAKPETFMGLSGLGDLIVTATSQHSRNFQAGFKMGSGSSIKEALDSMTMVVEGMRTCQSTYDLAKKMDVEMPIVEAIYDVVYNLQDPKEVLGKLMDRPLKSEF